MLAAEDVERQVAVAIVIAVKEPSLLMPVQRVVGSIEIEGDLLRCLAMRFEEEIDKELLDRCPVIADLVIACRLRATQLQPVEGRFAGQRRAVRAPRRQLAGQYRHYRVMAQLVMVDQVFVAQRNPKHTRPNKRWHRVFDQLPHTAVRKTRGKPIDQSDRTIRRTQQQGTGIRGDLAAVERRDHRASFDACKTEQIRATLRLHRGSPSVLRQTVATTRFSQIRGPDALLLFEKWRLRVVATVPRSPAQYHHRVDSSSLAAASARDDR